MSSHDHQLSFSMWKGRDSVEGLVLPLSQHFIFHRKNKVYTGSGREHRMEVLSHTTIFFPVISSAAYMYVPVGSKVKIFRTYGLLHAALEDICLWV